MAVCVPSALAVWLHSYIDYIHVRLTQFQPKLSLAAIRRSDAGNDVAAQLLVTS